MVSLKQEIHELVYFQFVLILKILTTLQNYGNIQCGRSLGVGIALLSYQRRRQGAINKVLMINENNLNNKNS